MRRPSAVRSRHVTLDLLDPGGGLLFERAEAVAALRAAGAGRSAHRARPAHPRGTCPGTQRSRSSAQRSSSRASSLTAPPVPALERLGLLLGLAVRIRELQHGRRPVGEIGAHGIAGGARGYGSPSRSCQRSTHSSSSSAPAAATRRASDLCRPPICVRLPVRERRQLRANFPRRARSSSATITVSSSGACASTIPHGRRSESARTPARPGASRPPVPRRRRSTGSRSRAPGAEHASDLSGRHPQIPFLRQHDDVGAGRRGARDERLGAVEVRRLVLPSSSSARTRRGSGRASRSQLPYGPHRGVWRSLVARSVRVGEVPSSNLGTPIALPAGAALRGAGRPSRSRRRRGSARPAAHEQAAGQADDVQVVALDALDERGAAALDRVAARAALPLARCDVRGEVARRQRTERDERRRRLDDLPRPASAGRDRTRPRAFAPTAPEHPLGLARVLRASRRCARRGRRSCRRRAPAGRRRSPETERALPARARETSCVASASGGSCSS